MHGAELARAEGAGDSAAADADAPRISPSPMRIDIGVSACRTACACGGDDSCGSSISSAFMDSGCGEVERGAGSVSSSAASSSVIGRVERGDAVSDSSLSDAAIAAATSSWNALGARRPCIITEDASSTARPNAGESASPDQNVPRARASMSLGRLIERASFAFGGFFMIGLWIGMVRLAVSEPTSLDCRISGRPPMSSSPTSV
mmetsp:Transcript_22648/g.58257  ORF Transcript_22648/g.58257 Transcript_22648/m.58257 type:complete len:204 (+) Transcript_22648:1070-1681(+)